ncbi:MAG TPA: hypothetical protein VG474_04655, partial [Solirubrobacteraceae bacterium]|nr:hypothetical protein [Solirubrobacteraceae bacterium]
MCVLVEDPDLGELLDERRHAAAERAVIAPELRLAAGELSWEERFEHPLLGLLVLEGLLGVRMQIPGRTHLELLGPGDVVVPWTVPAVDGSTTSKVTWCAFATARLAVLDRSFCLTIRGLPEIHEALAARFVMRARRLAFQLAVNALRVVDERVLLTLWHLADRWGRV